jgi:DNA-binding protein HU-beta
MRICREADQLIWKQRFQIMNKELVDAMAIRTGSSKADADRAVGALIETISDTLKKGDSVSLVGFGSFEARERAARIGRNPKTGEELKIADTGFQHSKQAQRLRLRLTAARRSRATKAMH